MVRERVYVFAGRIEGVTPGPRVRPVDLIAARLSRVGAPRDPYRGTVWCGGMTLGSFDVVSGEFEAA